MPKGYKHTKKDKLKKDWRQNHNTKENFSLYHKIHYWLKQNYGKATKCENPDCLKKSKEYEWSLKPDCDYEFKRKTFWMLCKSCHRKSDITKITRKKMSENAIKNKSIYKKFSINCLKCGIKINKPIIKKRYCKNCANFRTKKSKYKWQQHNKEKIKEKNKKYRQNNIEYLRKYHKQYYINHKEKWTI